MHALISGLRTTWRALRVALHLCLAVAMALTVACSFGRIAPELSARWWYAHLLRILGVTVRWRGAADADARLVVANHVSWLDIVVLGSRLPARFIAKSEVRRWPLIGWLAQAAGAFFFRRGSGGSKTLLERLYPYMEAGGSAVLFPEGTTSDGHDVLRFRARLFEIAVNARTGVQPIALRYHPGPDGNDVAPFIGDDEFLPHLWRVLRTPELIVDATLLTPLPPATSRDELCAAAHSAIADHTNRQRQGSEHPSGTVCGHGRPQSSLHGRTRGVSRKDVPGPAPHLRSR